MPPKKRFLSCEICGERICRRDREKRKFMAKFPLDESRCRQWVKYVGKEDLVYVPIEKLRALKYVCCDHFERRAFNKKNNRLKKSAVPSKNLKFKPLPDAMLLEFPCHIFSENEVSIPQVEASTEFGHIVTDAAPKKKKVGIYVEDNEYEDECDTNECDDSFQHLPEDTTATVAEDQECLLVEDTPSIPVTSTESAPHPGPVEVDDAQSVPSRRSSVDDNVVPDITTVPHEGICCNVCIEPIVGFRYVCVECPDYDLCAACEARSAHPAHYVLRVPGPRPYYEIKAVLEAIRRVIVKAVETRDDVNSTLDEIKSEPEIDLPEEMTIDGNDHDLLTGEESMTADCDPVQENVESNIKEILNSSAFTSQPSKHSIVWERKIINVPSGNALQAKSVPDILPPDPLSDDVVEHEVEWLDDFTMWENETTVPEPSVFQNVTTVQDEIVAQPPLKRAITKHKQVKIVPMNKIVPLDQIVKHGKIVNVPESLLRYEIKQSDTIGTKTIHSHQDGAHLRITGNPVKLKVLASSTITEQPAKLKILAPSTTTEQPAKCNVAASETVTEHPVKVKAAPQQVIHVKKSVLETLICNKQIGNKARLKILCPPKTKPASETNLITMDVASSKIVSGPQLLVKYPHKKHPAPETEMLVSDDVTCSRPQVGSQRLEHLALMGTAESDGGKKSAVTKLMAKLQNTAAKSPRVVLSRLDSEEMNAAIKGTHQPS